MLSLEYIAGLMDADGSISISISENRYKSKSGHSEPQFSFVCNLRQVPQYVYILEEIRDTLGLGNIYTHKEYSKVSTRMASWQTTKHEDTLRVCELLKPYLRIKQKEAILMIEALELWFNNKGAPKGSGYRRPEWVKNRIREIASQMNPSQQKETSRRNKDLRMLSTDIIEAAKQEAEEWPDWLKNNRDSVHVR
jgi:hypothetical protein